MEKRERDNKHVFSQKPKGKTPYLPPGTSAASQKSRISFSEQILGNGIANYWPKRTWFPTVQKVHPGTHNTADSKLFCALAKSQLEGNYIRFYGTLTSTLQNLIPMAPRISTSDTSNHRRIEATSYKFASKENNLKGKISTAIVRP